MYKKRVYTAGHSNQSQEESLMLLQMHDIDCIVNVRSVPVSKIKLLTPPTSRQEYDALSLLTYFMNNHPQLHVSIT